jgi:hypothetical protein
MRNCQDFVAINYKLIVRNETGDAWRRGVSFVARKNITLTKHVMLATPLLRHLPHTTP